MCVIGVGDGICDEDFLVYGEWYCVFLVVFLDWIVFFGKGVGVFFFIFGVV